MIKCLIFILLLGAAQSWQIFARQTTKQEDRDKLKQSRMPDPKKLDDLERKTSITAGKQSNDFPKENPDDPTQLLTPKEEKEIRKNLEPNPEDSKEFKNFLKQSGTGLFRLMPNKNCTGKFIVNIKKECEKSTYMGEYYSFVKEDYGYSEFFDLTYQDGSLATSDFWLQSILTSLGDIPIESLVPTSEKLKYLFDFVPQAENKAVKKQFTEIDKGIKADGRMYSRNARAMLNQTYALRLIGYRLENKVYPPFSSSNVLSSASKIISASRMRGGTDSILVLRIIRQDSDGSLSILWKELSKKKSPKIIFEKTEPLANFGAGS